MRFDVQQPGTVPGSDAVAPRPGVRPVASRAAGPAASRDWRWVVTFNGARDGYQVPLALAEAGSLETLVTDWYSPLDHPAFGRLARVSASVHSRLEKRWRPGLPSRLVRSMPARAALARLTRAGPDALDAVLGRTAGRLAQQRGAGVFAYSYYAHAAFEAFAGNGPRVIFQVHPHPGSLRRLFTEELRRVPDAADSLASELEITMSDAQFARLSSEPLAADLCIVASRYTAHTLMEHGVAEDRIRRVPYGVDIERFAPGPAPDRPFRVLFVGQMVQRKGLSYLLDAWRQLALPDAELVLAGRGRSDARVLERRTANVRVLENVSHTELLRLYRQSDVFCMPSLAEGFGLVYLEALACGTPVITTPCTGAADIVTDGREGFIVPERDAAALADRLQWCRAHRPRLAAMRADARRLAEDHSWATFRDRLRSAVTTLPARRRDHAD